jgi:hypothetical protein
MRMESGSPENILTLQSVVETILERMSTKLQLTYHEELF